MIADYKVTTGDILPLKVLLGDILLITSVAFAVESLSIWCKMHLVR